MIAPLLRGVIRAASPVAWALMSMAMLGGCGTESPVATNSTAARAPPRAATPRPVPAPRIAPERVTFDSLDHDPKTGVPVRPTGLLLHPSSRGGGPHPAVIAFHGCGGMYSTSATRRDSLSLRHPGNGRTRLHVEVPNGVNPGAGVTVAPNAAARDDAYAKLRRFLRAEIDAR